MPEPSGRSQKLFTRVDDETVERVERLAKDLYDGNVAMLVRIAVKRFVDEQESSVARVEDREREGVAA